MNGKQTKIRGIGYGISLKYDTTAWFQIHPEILRNAMQAGEHALLYAA
jgi:hypothetical protein